MSDSLDFLDGGPFDWKCATHEIDVWIGSDFVNPDTGTTLEFDSQALLVDGYFDTKLIAECSG